jgi:hypothetical protein
MRKYIKYLFATFAVMGLAFSTPAQAADQEVDADDYRKATPYTPFNGRGDGLYWHRTHRTPNLIGNGDGYWPIGPQYFETFAYGDGLGMQCPSGLQASGVVFSRAAGANTACDTTCAALSPPGECVLAFEAALADAGDIMACTDATADACLCASAAVPDTDCANTLHVGDMRRMNFGSGVSLMAYSIGGSTASSNMPDMDAASLDIAGDQANDEGIEIFGGMYGASGRPFIVGDDPAFEFCATTAMADADGSDDFHVGFRGVEAPNDVFDDYTDVASIGYVADEGTTAAITIETIVSGAGTVTTDTTMSNSTSAIELCVFVGDTGVVTYTVDGEAPTTTASLTLADGLAVVPFVHLLQQAATTEEVDMTLWRVRYTE